MTDDTSSLILEPPRHISARVDGLAEDMKDVKHRMSALEDAMGLVKREVAFGDESDARQQLTLYRLAKRVERIERRLELSDG